MLLNYAVIHKLIVLLESLYNDHLSKMGNWLFPWMAV